VIMQDQLLLCWECGLLISLRTMRRPTLPDSSTFFLLSTSQSLNMFTIGVLCQPAEGVI
jgi:hypothetical protein